MSKIYLAGKITGLDEQAAYAAFQSAEVFVESHGWEPLNPLKLVEQSTTFIATPLVPTQLGEIVVVERLYNDMLLDALKIVLTEAEAIFMLDNWQTSKGARIEHAIARELGIPVFYAANLVEAGS